MASTAATRAAGGTLAPAVALPATAPRDLNSRARARAALGDAAFFHLGLICVCAAFLLPFVWMASTSLKSLDQTTEYPPRFTPSPWQPANYVNVFRHSNFRMATYTRNTLIVALLTVVGTTISDRKSVV